MNALLAHVRSLIKAHGWAVQGVFDNDDPAKNFAYTVGLTEAGLPELWVATLSPVQGGALLNATVKTVLERFADVVSEGELDVEWSVPVRLRGPVSAEEAEANAATALYPHPRVVSVMQVLWPDTEGRFPGDDGYDEVGFPQRVLSYRGVDVG